MTPCANCFWELAGNEDRCPSCGIVISGGTEKSRSRWPDSPGASPRPGSGPSPPVPEPGPAPTPRSSFLTRFQGRVANHPSELSPGGAGALGPLLGVIALILLIPVLLPAILPLVVILLLPVIILGLMFKGSAGPALGCLGSVIGRARSSRDQHTRPGGVAFRLRTVDQALREVQFRGCPPRVALGDEVELSGFVVGSIVHVLNITNTTTGERRVSRLALMAPALVVIVLVLVAGTVGR